MGAAVVSGLILTSIGLLGTLAGERLERSGLLFVSKPAASVGFLVVALGSGALDSSYGTCVFVGLVLSLVGDVFLMFGDRASFISGLVAFLLAHVAYVTAFGVIGVSPAWAGAALAGATVVAVVVLRWLMPHVDAMMRGPVLAYVGVISAMVVLAVGTRGAGHSAMILIGALLFYLSDLFVARQRFVTAGFVNRLLGLPLYYAGQVLLALSIGA